jgi:hypothetical protein
VITRWLQGHLWPNGNSGKLRRLGTAWASAATGLREAGNTAGPAWESLEELASPELTKALAQMDLVAGDVEELANHYEQLGRACDDWADKIDEAHHRIRDILKNTIGWAVVAGAAGAVVGSLIGPEGTAGGAALGAGAAAEQAAAQIVPILAALDGAAGLAAGAAAGGLVAAGGLPNLQPLLQANPTLYNSEAGGGGMVSGPGGNYYQPPRTLKAFPRARRADRKTWMSGGRKRFRWKDDKGAIYEWDSQHGRVEVYNKRGAHQGEFDPNTSAQTKPADPTRRVDP